MLRALLHHRINDEHRKAHRQQRLPYLRGKEAARRGAALALEFLTGRQERRDFGTQLLERTPSLQVCGLELLV